MKSFYNIFYSNDNLSYIVHYSVWIPYNVLAMIYIYVSTLLIIPDQGLLSAVSNGSNLQWVKTMSTLASEAYFEVNANKRYFVKIWIMT